jgi:hypothetical protein
MNHLRSEVLRFNGFGSGENLEQAVKAGTESLEFSVEMGRAMAHGISGSAFSEASGGDFTSGFMAGAFGSAAGSAMTSSGAQDFFGAPGQKEGMVERTIAAALIGGTASELGGGKFANGAMTAGMQHLFNAEKQSSKNQKKKIIGEKIIEHESSRIIASHKYSLPLGAVKGVDVNSMTLMTNEFLIAEDIWSVEVTYGVYEPYDTSRGTRWKLVDTEVE